MATEITTNFDEKIKPGKTIYYLWYMLDHGEVEISVSEFKIARIEDRRAMSSYKDVQIEGDIKSLRKTNLVHKSDAKRQWEIVKQLDIKKQRGYGQEKTRLKTIYSNLEEAMTAHKRLFKKKILPRSKEAIKGTFQDGEYRLIISGLS